MELQSIYPFLRDIHLKKNYMVIILTDVGLKNVFYGPERTCDL
jgi:hypothetical protein